MITLSQELMEALTSVTIANFYIVTVIIRKQKWIKIFTKGLQS